MNCIKTINQNEENFTMKKSINIKIYKMFRLSICNSIEIITISSNIKDREREREKKKIRGQVS